MINIKNFIKLKLILNKKQIKYVGHIIESTNRLLFLINDVLETGLVEEDRSVTVHAGSGVGAVEVPRGILFHEYELNNEGLLTNANCIIPTGQNLANIDGDLRELAPQILDRSQDEIKLAMEMLIRAYDPCISCSVHMLNVEFTE